MPAPTILSLTTGLPHHRHQQLDLHDKWLKPYINSHRARAIYAAAEIETRYSVLADSDLFAKNPGTQTRNDLFMAAARPLAANTIGQSLAQAGLTPADIDHFIVISCTGFDNPGLDVLLAGDLGMRANLRRSALIGMGCYAGLTALDRAMLELAARPQSRVLILSLELCTLQFQPGNKLEDMVAGAIFGDGLAAAVVGPAPVQPENQPRLISTTTHTQYGTERLMGVHLSDTGFQIKLATRVPKLLRHIVPDLVSRFLRQSGLGLADVRFWGIHPGGVKIIDYVGQALELEPDELQYSRTVLRKYGNMSSSAIFFVLDEIMRTGQPQPGDCALLLTFGPGLTIELCLLRW